MKLLVYDTIYSKHLLSYADLILKYQISNSQYDEVHFIFNSQFLKDNEAYFSNNSNTKTIVISSLPSQIENKINSVSSVILKSLYELEFISKYCNENRINSVLFLYIDYFQIALGISSFLFKRFNFKFHGILFSTFFYQSRKINRLKSWFQLKLLLLSPQLQRLFILNDIKLVNYLNSHFDKLLFSYLPDPVKKPIFSNIQVRKLLRLNENDYIFLTLGRITSRKNIHNLIKAFNQMEASFLVNSKLIVCGEFSDGVYKELALDSITDKIRNNIIIIDRNLDDCEFDAFIHQSNCVCVAYTNFYGSSGIIGKAASARKIVLGSNQGIIGYIMDKYSLGISVDSNSIDSISDGIKRIRFEEQKLLKEAKFNDYCEDNSEESFLNFLFDKIV